MKSKEGFVQAYNAQAAVDAETQIIVAHELTQCGSDQGGSAPACFSAVAPCSITRSQSPNARR